MRHVDRFEVIVPVEDDEQLDWWFQAIEDYEISGAYGHRMEVLNLRDFFHPSTGEVPWSVHVRDDRRGVLVTEESAYLGSALAAGILISKFLQTFNRDDQILIPYARMPLPDEEGPFGGGVVEATYSFVAETTTDDLMKEARRTQKQPSDSGKE